jgi:predicted Rossmann fold nucleotide-binding protein DprA/Smf involved in DNA uptake
MWKAEPIHLPDRLAQRFDPEISARLVGVGNRVLLDRPLIGLLTSRECPGHVLLSTLDRIPEWVQSGWVILSGFHAPLEQQVMRSVLRRQGSVVKILARGLDTYRPLPLEHEPLESGRMLILTAAAQTARRTTRASALERNRLVLKLATERVIPYLATSSGLAALLLENDIGTKPTS